MQTRPPVSGKLSATISSWTAGGTDYTIDDTKTYDLRVRTTNPWGESDAMFAPLIYPVVKLTVSNIGVDDGDADHRQTLGGLVLQGERRAAHHLPGAR